MRVGYWVNGKGVLNRTYTCRPELFSRMGIFRYLDSPDGLMATYPRCITEAYNFVS